LRTQIKGNEAILVLKEDLVASRVEALAEEARLLLKNGGEELTDIALDASEIEFIDSRGISFVVALYKTASQAGLGFSLRGLSADMYNLCVLMKLDQVFPVSQR